MAESPSISPLPPGKVSQDFERLKTEALAEIQRLAAESWTDHNAHDPGITLMEAFCYAITELGLRVDLDISDLIASGNRRSPAQLPATTQVLPCGPVTTEDLRRVLLDHYLVGDARIDIGVPDELAYFEDPSVNPPLTYTPGSARLTPSGLTEVLLSFEDRSLNSNSFSLPVDVVVDGTPARFNLDFALPHWDEPEAAPFRSGGITLTTVTMLNPGSEWRALQETLTYFGSARIDFTTPSGSDSVDSWVLMRITDEPQQPALAIPQILDAGLSAVLSTAADGLISRFIQRVGSADAAVSTVGHYLHTWRNLGEFPLRLSVSRVQEIAVYARIQVAGTTGLEDLLADLLFALDCSLSPPLLFEDAAAQRARGASSDTVFEGPLLTHGLPARAAIEPLLREDRIYLSDVLRLLMQPRPASGSAVSSQENPIDRDILALTDLALANYVNNRLITDGATHCLRLVDIARFRPRLSLTKSRIVFVRDEVEIGYDPARVMTRFQQLQDDKRGSTRLAQFDPGWPVAAGDDLPVDDYYPFQNDLPDIYGVGEAGLPASASNERRQQALQLRGYLMPFEQFLADTTEQLININRYFSPSGEETVSYFTRPLLGLPDMDRLVRAFTGGNWADFVADPDNAYAQALRSAAEDQNTALDRRNRMLDHLLARHGEDAVAWGQELHRWGQQALLRTTLNDATLPARVEARRLLINRRLLRSKAGFLAEIPKLHALRLQAFGDPVHWHDELITIERVGSNFRWRIARNGDFVFESATPSATGGEALARARVVLQLAGTAAFYAAANLGGPSNRRYLLRDGPAPTDTILAHGTVGFPSLAAANAAAVPVRNDLAELRMRESRSAMERRIDHLIGIRHRGSRGLLTPLSDFFEIFNAPGPAFTRGWRLRGEPGPIGDILLTGALSLSDPVEATAIALAEADIERALEFAIDEWNYRITGSTPATLELVDMDGTVVAAAASTFAGRADAEVARDQVITLLYQRYSVEGLHSVENLLLRPQANGDPFLAIPIPAIPIDPSQSLPDPYSQRLTLVLPSGLQRDFTQVNQEPTPCRPHRFRDPEFRRHAERMIQQSCPAHLLPDIHWVDRQAPGSAVNPGSFDEFDRRYIAWLRSLLIAGASPTTVTNRRRALTLSINAIAGS